MLREAGSIVKQLTYGIALATLVGCKADMVEIDLSEKGLFAAGNGQASTVEFGATFSVQLGAVERAGRSPECSCRSVPLPNDYRMYKPPIENGRTP